MKFKNLINMDDFSIDNIDLSEIQKISLALPKNKVIDSNIAEKYIIATIEAQDLCQEKIIQVERLIGIKKIFLEKSEAECALIKAKEAGHKTAKEKEWFIQSDDSVNKIRDELDKARVCKLWLDNKIRYFSMWHYSLKAFIKRDYNIENSSNYSTFSETPEYNNEMPNDPIRHNKDEWGDIDWK